MKRLDRKLFTVICGILTLFLFTILFIFNYQEYIREYKNIEGILNRMNGLHEKRELNQKPEMQNIPVKNPNLEQRIFMDSLVYTVILKDKKVDNIYSHTDDGMKSDEIKKIAEEILNGNKNYEISNLYFNKYSYSIKNDVITIIDNNLIREKLYSRLGTSIVIFVLLEIVIVFVSVKLVKWITKPVVDSFLKQKQFVIDASHELKTPLAVVLANAEMIEITDDNKKWLDNIKSETERMNKLVVDLLSLAKLEKECKKNSVNNLSNLIEKAILPFESIMYEKNIKLDYYLDENIEFNCDQEQIKQLVVILLDNAIKHSTKKGRIVVDLEKQKNEIIIEVKNKGKEIKEEDRERIFERFYRCDSSRNRDENRFGLGLAIAKGIVDNHNGKIFVLYENGYTIFKIIFKQA